MLIIRNRVWNQLHAPILRFAIFAVFGATGWQTKSPTGVKRLRSTLYGCQGRNHRIRPTFRQIHIRAEFAHITMPNHQQLHRWRSGKQLGDLVERILDSLPLPALPVSKYKPYRAIRPLALDRLRHFPVLTAPFSAPWPSVQADRPPPPYDSQRLCNNCHLCRGKPTRTQIHCFWAAQTGVTLPADALCLRTIAIGKAFILDALGGPEIHRHALIATTTLPRPASPPHSSFLHSNSVFPSLLLISF